MNSFSGFACESLPNDLAASHSMSLVNNTDFGQLWWSACSASRQQKKRPCLDLLDPTVDTGWAYDGHVPSWVQVDLNQMSTVSQVKLGLQYVDGYFGLLSHR